MANNIKSQIPLSEKKSEKALAKQSELKITSGLDLKYSSIMINKKMSKMASENFGIRINTKVKLRKRNKKMGNKLVLIS